MFKTLRNIFQDNWEWRGQIWHLSWTEMQKEVRGTALGWVWLILTPAIYIGVLWVALAIGLKTGSPHEGLPYIAWLATGVIPWQFCSGMLTSGSNVYRRYPYLVNRLKFPISVISSFFTLARLLVFLMTMIVVVVVLLATRVHFTIHMAQFPILLILMFFFWFTWSLMTSPLTALSKDVHRLIRAFSMPLFWLSGVFFDINSIQAEWVRLVFAFNPIAFFVSGMRACFGENYWLWGRPMTVLPFAIVFVFMILLALIIQTRVGPEVADVL